MNGIFEALIGDALSEITRRDATFLSESGIPLRPSIDCLLRRRPTWFADQDQAMSAGIERVLAEGVLEIETQEADSVDAVSRVLAESVLDAYSASIGELRLRATPNVSEARVTLSKTYSIHSGRRIRYFVREGGSRLVLLVSATGITIDIWRYLLGDEDHDLRIVVPERRIGDLHQGGFREYTDIAAEMEDLGDIIETVGADGIELLAWCNGARLAISLASRYPESIRSVTLLCPMLTNIEEPFEPGSFERNLYQILGTARRQPRLAGFLSEMIRKQLKLPTWKEIPSVSTRGNTLLELPPHDLAEMLLAPLIEPESLINVAKRVDADQQQITAGDLRSLDIPVLLILGSHDGVINNSYAHRVVSKVAGPFTGILLSGGGHYIQDLQYSYFKMVLNDFFEQTYTAASPAARLSIL